MNCTWKAPLQQIDPDLQQVQSGGAREGERTVDAGVEVYEEMLAARITNELYVEKTAPANPAQQAPYALLELGVRSDRLRVRASSHGHRPDPG